MPTTLRQRFAPVLFITLMAVLMPRAAQAFTETNNLTKPHWISAPPVAGNQSRIEISREFTAPTNLLRAVLLLAGDSNCVAQLNDPAPLAAVGRDRAAGFDVTQRIRPGTNRVSIIDPRGFPQPTAAALELSHGDGTVTWIVTDTNWVAGGSGVAPARAISRGLTSANPATDPFDPARAFDAYNSWRLAKGANQATPANELTLLPGFTAKLIRSAQPGEDSWISLAFDPQGRLTIGKEKKGLLRFTLTNQTVAKVETINDTLLECRGLLYAHGTLYAMANNTKALVRLRDTNGDDRFDEIRELIRTEGGVGHGRNHVKLGPDGKLYLIHGDDVKLPPNVVSHCPPNFFQPDQLITAAWDEPLEQQRARMPLGHLLRCDPDGGNIEMICGGLRNPLDIAFNERGDIFTYDADNERDIGTPWYRPTRVLHLVSGGDYGWRRSTATWPEFRPDGLPAAVNIGVGSPTAVEFGTRSHFPERYRRALFICDWAYGRIIAVHLTAQGASYTGTHENFVTGRPLNVTDLAFGPDGAMYFATGGRQTQSGLYRVKFAGPTIPSYAVPSDEVASAAAREQRLKLEELHQVNAMKSLPGERNADALGASDPWVRHAARVAYEWKQAKEGADRSQSLERGYAWSGPLPTPIQLLLWQRSPVESLGDTLSFTNSDLDNNHSRFLGLVFPSLFRDADEDDQLILLRAAALRLIRHWPMNYHSVIPFRKSLEERFPSNSYPVNHELVELLAFLQSPQVVAKTLPLMERTSSSAELLRYLYCLRVVKSGWTLEQRREFLQQLARAEAMQGAREYYRSLSNIRAEFIASLNTSERLALRSLLEPKRTATPSAAPATFVRAWTLDDLLPHLDQVGRGRSAAGGREAFASAQCLACHRLGNDGGVLGPDLTSVGSRFGRRDVLEHILKPSLAIDEKFRQTRVRRRDGESVTGTLETDSGSELVLRPALLSEETVRVPAADIASREESDLSPMPEDLLNGLRLEQILDLLAWLESGGNEKHAAFRK